ncbi:MAG TPA: HAD hydrolase-like protein [Polyangiaceae bacterium]
MSNQPLTAFIFDFDGTLADTMNHVVPLYNSVADRFKVPQLSPADIPRLRRMGPRQAMDAYGIPLWKVPRIMHAVTLKLREQIDRLEPFGGVAETLSTLSLTGTRCLLLSSNSRENVEAFLRRHRFDFFERLVCGTSLFGKGARLRNVLAQASLLAGSVAYVGDEVRDIEAARSVGVQSIAVSWGYADRETLLAAKPNYLIDRPEQLLDFRSTSLLESASSAESPRTS